MAIDSLEEIQAGDSTQWIRVRGADASNPVLLLIQQGPGLPMINEARRFGHLLGLEQVFTVAYWDQRGCGRSLRRSKGRAGISLEKMVGDTRTPDIAIRLRGVAGCWPGISFVPCVSLCTLAALF